MTITTPIQMRFFDMDSFGHVSNVAQQMYFDQGKTDLFRELTKTLIVQNKDGGFYPKQSLIKKYQIS